ncbi:MAG: MBL fold metallo-hydrolase [Kiritimatiellaeota bacterium]|nr:MBL fold metallo-hydrolase [Kiritimatiellota bacterium]
MRIKRFVGGGLESNGYVIYQKEGGDCFVIDPGYNPEKFIKTMKECKLNILGILLTHHHHDHVGGAGKIRDAKECPVYLHRGDLDMYRGEVDVVLEGGEVFFLGGEGIEVLHTPGHTEGSVCFFADKSKASFTGDTVFNVDLGRTDLKGGSQRRMESSIRYVVDLWDNDVTIHPGHGDPCNMKFVRRMNKEFIDIIEMK